MSENAPNICSFILGPVTAVWLSFGGHKVGGLTVWFESDFVCQFAMSKIITYFSKFICFFWIKSAPSDLIYWVTSSPLFIETQGKLHTN